jgi:transposase
MATPNPVGRPTLLTPAIIEDFRRLLPTVLYLETVGDYLGVSRQTWRVWVRRGRKESDRLAKNPRAKPREKEAPYLEFFATYKKAVAEGELYDLGIIKKASADQVNAAGEVVRQGQWQAAAWRAERRFGRKWGRKDALAVTGKDGAPLALTLEQRQRAERELQEWERARDGAGPPSAEPPGATP